MKDFVLVMDYRDGELWINTECGSGAKYPVSNPKQVAFAVQQYIQNYCMEAADENT